MHSAIVAPSVEVNTASLPVGLGSCPSGTTMNDRSHDSRIETIKKQSKDVLADIYGDDESGVGENMVPSKTRRGGERLGEEVQQVSGRMSRSSLSSAALSWPNQPGGVRPDTCCPSSKELVVHPASSSFSVASSSTGGCRSKCANGVNGSTTPSSLSEKSR